MTTDGTVKGIAATLRYHGDEHHARAVEALAAERDRAEERSRLHAADANRAAERWAAANARVAAVEMERDAALADAKQLREREEHFARALSVADGGQYRADWPGAIGRLLAERDALRSLLAAYRCADDTPWPLPDSLERLATAADHLLDDHNCDEEGNEEVRHAIASARRVAAALRAAMGGAR